MAGKKHNILSPDLLLRAYAQGIFPMSEDADDDDIFWVCPEYRGIIPLNHFHIPRSLEKFMRKNPYDIRIDADFTGVIQGCAETKNGRESTWINKQIIDNYTKLYKMGFCHSIEAWKDEKLIGGLYGIALGGAFFGESMFSRASNASKICLVHLVKHLNKQGFILLDTQFSNPHLEQFGVIEIPRADYEILLANALTKITNF